MKKAAHRLALVAAPSALSLQILSVLSKRYSVSPWSSSERVVSRFREERPALVVVMATRRNQSAMRRLVRSLKTEQRPPTAGLIFEKGLPEDAQTFLRESQCDGILGFPATDDELFSWMDEVLMGKSPVLGRLERPGKIRKVVRRLSGSRVSSGDG